MSVAASPWSALRAARLHDPATRRPVHIGRHLVGSVARVHLRDLAALQSHPALRPWVQGLRIGPDGARLQAEDAEAASAALAAWNEALRDRGLIRGWRDEPIEVPALEGGATLAHMERAAARFWGTRTLGAHANGYVRDAQGRPRAVWIARRALSKATDPGRLDNLIGGGVPAGQTPLQALVREGWEEAGLMPSALTDLQPGRVIRLLRDIPEGLQCEDLHVFDLAVPADYTPVNQDGEVASFECLPVEQALALAAGADMTVDAALVTLDFGLRHGLLPEPAGAAAVLGTWAP